MPAESTYTLNRMVLLVRRFIFQSPLIFAGTTDPALAMGDWVRNTILQPPFAWRWNRTELPLPLITGQQDYVVNIPNFGWLESSTVFDTVNNAAYRLEIDLNPGSDVVNNQPNKISARIDDGNGNITFRVTPPPTANFTTATLTYQNAAPKFARMSDTWAPIPDYFSHLIQQGMLAKAYEFVGDERFPATLQMFVRSLIAANGGLTESQNNVFVADMMLTAQNAMMASQIAHQSRGLV